MRFLIGFCLFITSIAVAERDPFWPIGYKPAQDKPEKVVEKEAEKPKAPRELTDEELRLLAEQEAQKIKEILDRDGTAVFGGKVHALINGNWVSKGDTLTIEALGNTYRLQIITLTTNNIDLKPQRTQIKDR